MSLTIVPNIGKGAFRGVDCLKKRLRKKRLRAVAPRAIAVMVAANTAMILGSETSEPIGEAIPKYFRVEMNLPENFHLKHLHQADTGPPTKRDYQQLRYGNGHLKNCFHQHLA